MVRALRYPVLMINFKAYRESIGRRGLELARAAERVSKELSVCIAVLPQHVDLRMISESVDIPVLAQSADPVLHGAYTGHVTLDALRDCGVDGVLVNHSERRIRLDEISLIIREARRLGLQVVACAPDAETSASIAVLGPDAVAVEPPELIGTGRAVSRERPDVLVRAVKLVREHAPGVHVICGAGIESVDDVRKAVELGTEGVLVASAIVKAEDWYRKIKELAEGLVGRR